jgi:hypothetical protein
VTTRRLPLAAVLLIVVVGSVFLLVQARYLWFLGDDWNFLLERDLTRNPVDDLMRPHNEHWSTVPVVIFRAMFTVFGLQNYLAFASLPVVAHGLVCVLLFLLLQRCGVRPWTAVGVAAVMVFLGAGAENLLWDFQVGMLLSAVFGLAALALSMRRGRRAVATTWSLSVLAMMSASTALPMLAWLGVFTLLRGTFRRAVVLTVPPAVVYGVWYLVWGRHHGVEIPPTPLESVVPLAWNGLGATWASMTGIGGAGPAILLGLVVAALAVATPGSDLRALAVSGMATALVSFLLFAYSRGTLGEQAAASRYLYFGALMTLPAFAVILDALVERLPERRAERAWTVAVVVGALVVPGVAGIVTNRVARAPLTTGLEQRVVAAADLAGSDARLLGTLVEPTMNSQIKVDALRQPGVRERLPDIEPTLGDRLGASAALQVGASPTSLGLPVGRLRLRGGSDARVDGCVSGSGAEGMVLEMDAGESGAEFQLTLTPTDRTLVRLRKGGLTGPPVPLVTGAGTPVFVGVTAAGTTLEVDLPAGSLFTACEESSP